MTVQLAYTQLSAQLYDIYDKREAANIADLVIEYLTGQRKIDRIVNKGFLLTHPQQQDLQALTTGLLQYKPVQYVLNEAWFCNMKLYVDENVLIPRPETEELVKWVIDEMPGNAKYKMQKIILDVGTGSGCIALAIKKKYADASLHAVDVSVDALNVAKQNAVAQNVEVQFYQLDFLDENQWSQLPTFDIIVSNPPYVKKSEKVTIARNVFQYEPHIALFVPDEDALKFYRAIAEFAKTNLKANGNIYLEINEALGNEVAELFKQNGFGNIVVRKDMQVKNRMIKACAY